MTSVPRLTIGLPVYNGENYLTESLEALLGQSYENFELLISDNASTDGTADICHRYGNQDSRIRYVRQPRNIGCAPNDNFVMKHARGELFKLASHDDLYARDLLKRCVEALDQYPQFVLAWSWSAVLDVSGTVSPIECPVATDSMRTPERFRSMLFDGWMDSGSSVIRRDVLLRTGLQGSYHFADRTFITEIGLHGPFYQVPDWLYFRREHPEQGGGHRDMRARCEVLDPRRADRIRHPAFGLYAEYVWGYLAAIRRAPLSSADRRECYRYLARWMAGRALPVAGRVLLRRPLEFGSPIAATQPEISIDALVAGREVRPSDRT